MTKPYQITDEDLSTAVKDSITMQEVLRRLGIKLAGGSQSHYTRRVKKLGIDTTHFMGQSATKGKPSPRRRDTSDILVKRESGGRAKSKQLVRALLDIGRIHECSECGQGPIWRGNTLTLDVDHINEDWLDDRAENLRFLCPNCHSQFSRNLIGSVA